MPLSADDLLPRITALEDALRDLVGVQDDWVNPSSPHAVPDDGAPPAAPTGVVATGYIEAMSVTWDPNTEVDMVLPWGHYRVEFSGDNFATPPSASIVSSMNFVYNEGPGLGGVDLYVRVVAIDAHGNESEPSASSVATIIAPPADNVGIPTVEDLPELPDPDYPEDYVVILDDDHKLYKNVNDEWEPIVSAVDLEGQITSTQITDGSVTTLKLAALAVIAEKIAAGSIETDKLAALSVIAAKIAAGSIETDKLAAGSVETNKLAANAVVAAKIAAGSIDTDKLAASSVVAAKIAAGSIDTDKLAANAVVAAKIAANAIETDKLAANAVTAEKLAAITLEVGKYLRSSDYDGTDYATGDATQGWNIDPDGIEAANLRSRGSLETDAVGEQRARMIGSQIQFEAHGLDYGYPDDGIGQQLPPTPFGPNPASISMDSLGRDLKFRSGMASGNGMDRDVASTMDLKPGRYTNGIDGENESPGYLRIEGGLRLESDPDEFGTGEDEYVGNQAYNDGRYLGRVTQTRLASGGPFTSSSTSYTNVTGAAATIDAEVGDWLEIGLSMWWANAPAVNGYADGFISAGSHYISGSTSTDFGVKAWEAASGSADRVGGSIMYQVQSGDVVDGQVTVQLRMKCSASTTRNIAMSDNHPLHFWVKNHGS